ncbi:sigma-54 interaction domain-containing protein [Siminovitchia sediminis]|uniref:Sigma-54 interaction domain-containing protein n=1 Tax=Siminovitchia sediminis TaxID=1274353 RepID=A0ABW4KLJ7_9BACI
MASINLEEGLLKDIILNSFDEIFITDGQGIVLDVSPTCYELYGVESSELVGKSVFELEKKGILNPSVSALVLKHRQTMNKVQETNTGKRVLVSAYPYFKDGELAYTYSYSRDITELESLKRRNEEVAKTLAYYKEEFNQIKEYKYLYFKNKKMEQVMDIANKVADLDVTVLIEGESGVGKNQLAYSLHKQSSRSNEPFVEVNCGAIPESLFESEVFGYEEGAYTGAKRGGKAGSFEQAGSGTLFLDEIGEMPLNLQVKLLSVLQNKRITRLGGSQEIDINCRIICATNSDLKKLVEQGKFREDLYYRLDVIKITIPPLRERKDEIEPLIEEFTREFNEKYRFNKHFSSQMIALLTEKNWPGNVRELRNFIERTMITSNEDIITFDTKEKNYDESEKITPLHDFIEAVEGDYIKRMFAKFPNSIALGKALQISQSTANRKIQKYIKSTSQS